MAVAGASKPRIDGRAVNQNPQQGYGDDPRGGSWVAGSTPRRPVRGPEGRGGTGASNSSSRQVPGKVPQGPDAGAPIVPAPHSLSEMKQEDDAQARTEQIAPPAQAEKERARRKRGSLIKELIIVLVAALAISTVVKTFFYRAYVIPSGSMENTLQIHDRVFVNLLSPEVVSLKRGDVVVFKDELGWLRDEAPVAKPGAVAEVLTFLGLRPDDGTQHLVKRVIGMPGDTVTCCSAEGKLEINGVEIDEPYLYAGDDASNMQFKTTVPEGKVWVMGDHRSGSADSRLHQDVQDGFVDISAIEGRADFIAWPFDRLGGVEGPGKAFEEVPDEKALPYRPEEGATSVETDPSAGQ